MCTLDQDKNGMSCAYYIGMSTTTNTHSLSIKTAGNKARAYLGPKASSSDVGKLGARLIVISRTTETPLQQVAAELKLLQTWSS